MRKLLLGLILSFIVSSSANAYDGSGFTAKDFKVGETVYVYKLEDYLTGIFPFRYVATKKTLIGQGTVKQVDCDNNCQLGMPGLSSISVKINKDDKDYEVLVLPEFAFKHKLD